MHFGGSRSPDIASRLEGCKYRMDVAKTTYNIANVKDIVLSLSPSRRGLMKLVLRTKGFGVHLSGMPL